MSLFTSDLMEGNLNIIPHRKGHPMPTEGARKRGDRAPNFLVLGKFKRNVDRGINLLSSPEIF